MKFIHVTRTASLLLLFGAAAPAFAQDSGADSPDRHDARQDRQTRDEERSRRDADQRQQRRAEDQRQKQVAADQKESRRAEKQKQKQIDAEQKLQARRDRDQSRQHRAEADRQQQHAADDRQRQHAADERQQQLAAEQQQRQHDADRQSESRMQSHPERTAEQSREWQRRRDWDRNGGWQNHDAWRDHRSTQWDRDHRTWGQRGGYGGFYIPLPVFSLNFGTDHFFRIETRPTIYMGHPRFSYRGTSFVMVDPYPESWGENWTDNDDVYIEYNDGYYLHNRRDPSIAIAVTVEE